MPDLTPAQHRAITLHDKNLVVTAGAGSGKTRVLVERYLSLLEANRDWPLNAVVAITFTEKAAQEMRDRVRTEMEKRMIAAESDMAAHWSALLAQMDSARISTIHGLCASILRANAAEAGVDPDFEVLEEIDASILLEDAVDGVLNELASDQNHPTRALLAEYDTASIRVSLAQPALINRELPPLPSNLFEVWWERWLADVKIAVDEFAASSDILHILNWQPKFGWPTVEDKLYDIWREVHLLTEELFTSDEQVGRIGVLHDWVDLIKLNVGSARAWGDRGILDHAKHLLKVLRHRSANVIERVGERPRKPDKRAADLIVLWDDLIRRVQQAYRSRKQQASLLDFDDLERLTSILLLEHEAVQARYQDNEFRHVLVDEFQDTNQAQWHIIQSISGLDRPGSLFVVGDPKQSVYAFRGADVSVFGSVQDQIVKQGGEAISLSRSFRSHQNLVREFNEIFDYHLQKTEESPVQEYEVVYEIMSANREEAPGPICLDLIFLETQRRTPGGNFFLDMAGKRVKINAEHRRQWEAYELAQHLRNRVESQQLVYDRTSDALRPLRYDDIAVLFQSMSHITLYEDIFKSVGLPFVTIAGRGYYRRQEIWDMLNLLKALHQPADNLSLAAALRSPMFHFSDDLLLALRRDYTKPLWDALADDSIIPGDGFVESDLSLIRFAHETLSSLRSLSGRVTIAELIQEALNRTGYLAALSGLPDGARRRGNLEKLVELAQESGKLTVGGFSRYLEELSVKEAREGEALLETSGSVTMMTVHASKGLEYPVIVLADASWTAQPGSRSLVVFDKEDGLACKVYHQAEDQLQDSFAYRRITKMRQLREEAESKRLLYVAATRAQDYLIVSGHVTEDDGYWYAEGWLEWIMEGLGLATLEYLPEQIIEREWGSLRLSFPIYVSKQSRPDAQNQPAIWDDPRINTGMPIPDVETVEPMLLRPVKPPSDAPLRHLSAARLADLGGAHHAQRAEDRQVYQERLRRYVLHEVPTQIVRSLRQREPQVTGQKIGDIVHEALRYWRFPENTSELDSILRGYAWQQGITDPDDLNEAISESRQLLRRFQQSELFRWIDEGRSAGRPFYPELPFIFQTEKRVIHGVMDLLFQRADGQWMIIDYKTSSVKNYDTEAVKKHAERYHLQVGVYAAAAQAQLGGITPQVLIHYIRHTQTVEITAEIWQTELSKLEEYIGVLALDEDI